MATRKPRNCSALPQREFISCFCPKAMWLGSPWVVFDKEGLRYWAQGPDQVFGSFQLLKGVSAVTAEGEDREGGHAVGFMGTSPFFPQFISQNLVTWSQPNCEGDWETRSSLCANLCHALL